MQLKVNENRGSFNVRKEGNAGPLAPLLKINGAWGHPKHRKCESPNLAECIGPWTMIPRWVTNDSRCKAISQLACHPFMRTTTLCLAWRWPTSVYVFFFQGASFFEYFLHLVIIIFSWLGNAVKWFVFSENKFIYGEICFWLAIN